MIFMSLTFCVFYQADDVLKLASLTNVVQVKAWTYYLEGRGGGLTLRAMASDISFKHLTSMKQVQKTFR